MQMNKILLLVAATICVQACTSPKMSEELQQGKSTFTAGDYKNAFRELLPIAVDGNAEAQYAVGYMYYYGFGVEQDTQTGLVWIKKSATQNNLSAKNALKKM